MAIVEDAVCAGAERRSIVVLPSRTVDRWHEPPAETRAYEERLLCFLFQLRDPRLRMTYVTSLPIAPATVGYYLSMLPARIQRSARARLTLVSLSDAGTRPLSDKLLARTAALERIRRAIPEPDRAYLLAHNSTAAERDLALALDIPIYGPDPAHRALGTKSGSRELFALSGVPLPLGAEHIRTIGDAVEAVCRLRAAKAGLAELVMKLNEGVSGEGNAIVDLRGLPAPGAPKEAQLVEQRLRTVVPEVSSASTAAYFGKLATQGGVVEERIAGIEIRSPSAQLEITAHRQVAVLSTHDQILDGKSGQRYVGCRFPAESAYAPMISTLARRVGERLADLGVIGRFAIDFVVSRTPDGRWDPFAVELNLRLGATTHPFHTLAQLAPGTYDAENATFTTRRGQPRYYVATDHLKAPQLRQLGRDATLALAQRKDLRFSRARGTGAVFHMLSSVNELARIGVTAIADTAQRADALFDHVQASLTTLAPDARRLRGRHALRRQLTLGLQ